MGWFREKFLGEGERYKYGDMCVLSVPWSKGEKKKLNFYTKDEKLPILLAGLLGLQHAMSMVGGIITVPYVIFRFAVCFDCVQLQQYAISAALITSGIFSMVNCSKIPIPFTEKIFKRQLYLGAGVLSVMGTSFTFLPIYQSAITQMIANGVEPRAAYGKMLGTSMLTCLLEGLLSIMPLAVIARVFPPLVTSITVMLIGAALTGEGMKSWAGGSVCGSAIWKQNGQINATAEALIPENPSPICENGDVFLGYGSPEFVGLGFTVLVFLVFIELFGSVFMKNCNVIIALLFGYMIAGVTNYEGFSYVSSSAITEAKAITFLWVETFPLGLYGPAVIPLLIGDLVLAVESIGDITAVYDVSGLSTSSRVYSESIQGGLTNDCLSSIMAGLFTSMPVTTFAQNNGVIAMTKCASRRAGYACGMWLIFMGVFGKIAGIITSIPDCVIGGMTIFLFANVLVSGISLAASTVDLESRRVKFIMAMSLALGLGVTIWPFAFQDQLASPYTANFWRCDDCTPTLKGLRDGVSIFLSTGYCIGTVTAMLLNFILPDDPGVNLLDEELVKEVEGPGDDREDAIHVDDTVKTSKIGDVSTVDDVAC